MTAEAIARALRARVAGPVVRPGDADYDQVRQVWNAAVDRHPVAVVRPAGEADVVAAVRVAGEHGLPVSVRAGGHSHAGHGVGEGAVMLDLSGLRGVRVDPAGALATAEPGATWGDFDAATQAFGLAATGADIPAVGVAGSTLGGGFGWLHRLAGLSCDTLRSARVVTADGQVRTASATEHPDLLWGLRGGGGNLGVATALTLDLRPVRELVTGALLLPLQRATEGLRAYRELCAQAPDELFTRAMLAAAPSAPFVPQPLRGRPALLLSLAWFGPPEGAADAVQVLAPLAPPGMPWLRPATYLELQRSAEAGFPGRVRAYADTAGLHALPDELIDLLVEAAGAAPTPFMIALQPGGGAMARVDPAATAFPHRRAALHLLWQGLTPPGSEGEEHVGWVRALTARLTCHTGQGRYGNLTMGDQSPQAAALAGYADNLDRLADLKAIYDPDNMFRFNCNVAPASAGVDRVGTSVLYANDRVRVWELTLGPGESCPPHRHRHDYVILYPQPALMRPHDTPHLERVQGGLTAFVTVGRDGLPPHSIANAGDQPATHYIVELLDPTDRDRPRSFVHNGRTEPVQEVGDD